MNNRFRANRPFTLLSWLLLATLFLGVLFGSKLMPHPYLPEQASIFANGHLSGATFTNALQKPNSQHWFGTDPRGYDITSLLLNGAKYTLGFGCLVTITRFLLALPLGLYAGTTTWLRKLLNLLQSIFSTVPGLLFLYPMMYGIGHVLPAAKSVYFLFAMLLLLGFFPLAYQFSERARFYRDKPYVVAARVMGASTPRVLYKHIWPHLRSELFLIFMTDLVLTFFLLGQLAVVGISIDSGQVATPVASDGGSDGVAISSKGEWSSVIVGGFRYLRNQPWITGAPILFLTLTLLILQFFISQQQSAYKVLPTYRVAWWHRKSTLGMVAAAVATSLVLYLLPVVKVPSSLAVSTANTTNPSVPSESQYAYMQLEIDRPKIMETSQAFMKFLSQGKWESASAYLRSTGANDKKIQSNPPFPFNDWLNNFTKNQYTFVDVSDVQLLTKLGADPVYRVQIHVKNGKGVIESWTMRVDDSRTVLPDTDK